MHDVVICSSALFLNWVGLCVIISLSMLNGIVMYAYYHGCDPLSTGDVGAADQVKVHLPQKIM